MVDFNFDWQETNTNLKLKVFKGKFQNEGRRFV